VLWHGADYVTVMEAGDALERLAETADEGRMEMDRLGHE